MNKTSNNRSLKNISDLAQRIIHSERRALARAITLIESTRPDHQKRAEALLEELLPRTGHSIRVGLSGAPGVGKSTFIEAFGTYLIREGCKVAVLAVDPTSRQSGGSILGDKTRMENLAREPNAFIRPSPAGLTLGGVARRTREAILLVEAAGFNVVLVETVGVGQSETAVADMVDMFLLLLSPAGGDELQGIKRGIMELADLVVINKADGELETPARRAAASYRNALHLMRPKTAQWTPQVVLASALEQKGMADIWETIQTFRATLEETGEFKRYRAAQAKAWMWTEIREGLLATFEADPDVANRLAELEEGVVQGRITPMAAARQLLALFRHA